MRVTITKTIDLEEIPAEIEENYIALDDRLAGIKSMLLAASDNAREGRYIDSTEILENLRKSLVIVDKNIEEQQSLCLSYEKIRISNQMPEQVQSDQPQMGISEDE